MSISPGRLAVLCLGLVAVLFPSTATSQEPDHAGAQAQSESGGLGDNQPEGTAARVHYLEIGPPAVNETCEALAKAHGLTFGEPVAEFGNARTAELEGVWHPQ